METLEHYRDIIEGLVEEWGNDSYKSPDLQLEAVIDRQRDRYTILTVGLLKGEPICEVDLHLEIINGIIWVQRNAMGFDVIERLVEAGIPQEYIVTGRKSTNVCKVSEYAVA